MQQRVFILFLFFISHLVNVSCDNNNSNLLAEKVRIEGTSSFDFNQHPLVSERPLRVYYHIPPNLETNSPVLLVFHGNGRNAEYSRDVLIAEANRKRIAVLVPEFTQEQFPGGDQYNLANIFTDGDNPSFETLNPKEEWTFSLIEPLFNNFKEMSGLTTPEFDIFGHSAGGQVAHRYLLFWPDAAVRSVVAAAAGWYTVPDISINFPYGLRLSPAQNFSGLSFLKPMAIVVGTADDNPNAPGLRKNNEANAQGPHRLARARHFYQESVRINALYNINLNWQLEELTGVGHNYEATAAFAMNFLY
jgi:hypothetical protein